MPETRSSFIGELVDVSTGAAGEPELTRWILGNLSTYVPFESAIYLPLPHRPAPPIALNRDRKYLELYKHLLRDYARITTGQEKGQIAAAKTGSYRDSEVFSAKERRELPLFAEIIRPQGISSQLVSHVTFRGERCGIMYLSRHGRTRAFSAKDEAALSRLLPAIALSQASLRSHTTQPDNCEALTPREQQIAFYVERGFRNLDIAAILGTSARTVRNQLSKLFDKVNVTNRAELVSRLRGRAG